MNDPRQRILFIRSGFMGPLRRDTLPSSDSFSARNSKGGIFQEGVILVSSPLFISLPDPSADGEGPLGRLRNTMDRCAKNRLIDLVPNSKLNTQNCEAISNS